MSIIGGAISANAELLTAPTKEIIGPKFGMQTARRTKMKQNLFNEVYLYAFQLT